MDAAHIRNFAHTHCRFKLRNGREVFGVIWEVETAEHPISNDSDALVDEDPRIFFASVRDYERLQNHPGQPIGVIPMRPEEIVLAERIAS